MKMVHLSVYLGLLKFLSAKNCSLLFPICRSYIQLLNLILKPLMFFGATVNCTFEISLFNCLLLIYRNMIFEYSFEFHDLVEFQLTTSSSFLVHVPWHFLYMIMWFANTILDKPSTSIMLNRSGDNILVLFFILKITF